MDLLSATIGEIAPCDDGELRREVRRRLDSLTKPRGSLGRLEEIVLSHALMRGQALPAQPRKGLAVFCADHGIAAEGVSAFPKDVTAQMAANFSGGGAAINVLCRHYGIDPVIVDMGVDADFGPELSIVGRKIARGTRNFLNEPAMTREQASQAVETGISLAKAMTKLGYELLAAGEMGIGNTTSASAIVAALVGGKPHSVVGAGTGIDADRQLHKAQVIEQALERRRADPADPLGVLAAVGGFEIGAMAGFFLGAASSRVPIVVDGFIASVAALLGVALAPTLRDYLFFSHLSTERGHRVVLERLKARPLLTLEMRLGEGTGAAAAMGLIDAAIRLYREMATFDSAAVSDKQPE